MVVNMLLRYLLPLGLCCFHAAEVSGASISPIRISDVDISPNQGAVELKFNASNIDVIPLTGLIVRFVCAAEDGRQVELFVKAAPRDDGFKLDRKPGTVSRYAFVQLPNGLPPRVSVAVRARFTDPELFRGGLRCGPFELQGAF